MIYFYVEPIPQASLCVEPLAVGNCSNYKVRWYFNKNRGECEAFVYTGCGGNSNNFISQDKCESMCKRQGEGFFPQT